MMTRAEKNLVTIACVDVGFQKGNGVPFVGLTNSQKKNSSVYLRKENETQSVVSLLLR